MGYGRTFFIDTHRDILASEYLSVGGNFELCF